MYFSPLFHSVGSGYVFCNAKIGRFQKNSNAAENCI